MAINRDGVGVFVIVHGGSRRVGSLNEAVTGRGDGKMDGWTKGRREGVLLPLLLLCVKPVSYTHLTLPTIYPV